MSELVFIANAGQDPEFTIAMASPSGKEIYTFTCPEAKRLKELQENISNFFTVRTTRHSRSTDPVSGLVHEV